MEVATEQPMTGGRFVAATKYEGKEVTHLEKDEDALLAQLWASADEGDGIAIAVHGPAVVIGIFVGKSGAKKHFPAHVARSMAVTLLQAAERSEESDVAATYLN